MKIPSTARYKYCVNAAHEFLVKNQIKEFPINMEMLIRKNKWALTKYSELAEKHSIPIGYLEDTISEDGYSYCNGRGYDIVYNDTIAFRNRIYFTKGHEVGHIELKHFIDFMPQGLLISSLSEEEYKVLENEANCFARNVFVPAVIVKALNISEPDALCNLFGISLKAAKVRLSFLEADLYRLTEEQKKLELSMFHNFLYHKSCVNCGQSVISKEAKFCPICGSTKLVRGDGDIIYRDGPDVDEDGRAYSCPRCGNEVIDARSDYCIFCGADLVNRCSQSEGCETIGGWLDPCGAVARGNSRYCETCGCPTTFYKNHFLISWVRARKIILAVEAVEAAYKSEITEAAGDESI